MRPFLKTQKMMVTSDRRPRLSYAYTLHKMCDLLGMPDRPGRAGAVESNTLAHHDMMWARVCEELGWELPGRGKGGPSTTARRALMSKTRAGGCGGDSDSGPEEAGPACLVCGAEVLHDACVAGPCRHFIHRHCTSAARWPCDVCQMSKTPMSVIDYTTHQVVRVLRLRRPLRSLAAFAP